MAITDYASLKTTAADYLHRSDLSDSVVSNFVQLGEARLNRKLRLLEQEASSTLTLASGGTSVTLPADWIETIDVIYSTDKRSIQPQNIRNLNSQRTYDSTTGRPYLYATTNGTMIFEITANETYDILLDYFSKWDVATDDTNWLLTNAPDAYLYATLLEAKAYIKNIQDVTLWADGLATAIEDLNRLDNRSRRNATSRVDSALVRQGRYDINRGF
mgnify:FL=1|tara:strand:+ start:682 stop:1329 length:648 start_codon:yes stop_codon:yes gene_type:complete